MAMKMSSSVVCVVLVMVVAMATTAPTAEAQPLPVVGQILGTLFQIRGTVFCAINATASAPPFANANVILQCGGVTVASTTTNSSGGFTITLNPITATIPALTGNCRLVVNTPLATCNVTLPAVGGLVSQVQAVGTSLLGGLLTVVSFVPTGFVLVADLII